MLPAFHPVPIGCGENAVKRPWCIPNGFPSAMMLRIESSIRILQLKY
ncbi:hypothetical protein BQ8794_100022 [Mesorhizobium prunaredense]|uniref:Uncharacterized protein n=1 Tax=Mesorhizobium prunaredense TaxID=1631249 RepID=A0A1R3UZQ8_9HYPH|nr:hypothetical protein BQ8794_100022 [Mesorhizobium prunaredense]